MAANNPRHGDPIIIAVDSAIGGKKLIASEPFQAFLDQLGILFDTLTSTTSEDALQLLTQNNTDMLSKIDKLQLQIKPLSDNLQLIEAALSQIMHEKAESGRINKRILDLEQLAHVN